jgi:two-component system sensor histidine kinase PilS (NtrC family)
MDNPDTLIFVEDTRQITQQAQQLKLASLGRLTASIAHEIRNPLSAISHAAQLMQESTELKSDDKRLANIVENHSQRVNTIIENVISLSRRSQATPHKFELQTWLEEFVKEFCQAHQYDADLILVRVDPVDLQVSADSEQLKQVLFNLCQNGMRYSEKHTGKANLALHAYQSATNDLPALDIIDEGPGIPEDDRSRIFEPFFTTENSGTGLGLYLAKELCEANQVNLDYLVTDQGKSCFRLGFQHPERRLTGPAANTLIDEPDNNATRSEAGQA